MAGGEHQAGLGAHIFGHVRQIHLAGNSLIDALGVGVGQVEQFSKAVFHNLRVFHQVNHSLHVAAQLLVDQKRFRPSAADRPVLLPLDFSRDTSIIPPVGIGPAVAGLDLFHRGVLRQGVAVRLSIRPAAVIHIPVMHAKHIGSGRQGWPHVARSHSNQVIHLHPVQGLIQSGRAEVALQHPGSFRRTPIIHGGAVWFLAAHHRQPAFTVSHGV